MCHMLNSFWIEPENFYLHFSQRLRYTANVCREARNQELTRYVSRMSDACSVLSLFCDLQLFPSSVRLITRDNATLLLSGCPHACTIANSRHNAHSVSLLYYVLSLSLFPSSKAKESKGRNGRTWKEEKSGTSEDYVKGMLSTIAGIARRIGKDRREFGNKTLYWRSTAAFRGVASKTSK